MVELSNTQQKLTAPFGTLVSIDLGSNSFHMLVAEVNADGKLEKIESLRDSVRLGQGLTKSYYLTEQAQERALVCLERFARRIKDISPSFVRVAGTNTLRKAKNSSHWLLQAEAILGHPIEVISGAEEARMIYKGVAYGHPSTTEKRLVIDIGGGSTEWMIGRDKELLVAKSVPVGCVSLSTGHFIDGFITPTNYQSAIDEVNEILGPLYDEVKGESWQHCIGCSGTIKAIFKIIRKSGWHDTHITLPHLKQLRSAMLAIGQTEGLNFPGMKNSRKPVLPGGLAALTGLFETFSIERMEVSRQALREGLLYDLLHEDQQTTEDETLTM